MNHVLHSLQRGHRIVFDRASGSRMWDVEGREYLDAISGTNGPAAVGHARPEVTAAIAEQAGRLPSTFLGHDSVPLVRYADRMAALAPGDLDKTYLCPGGGEAVEAAVKLAAFVTGRPGVISLQGAYHGLSLGTMSLGGLPALRDWFPGGVRWPEFRQVALPDRYRPELADEPFDSGHYVAALETSLDEGAAGDPAAVVMELVQGPGGHVELPADYTRSVAALCRERGILLIVDEVQTGLGRCGEFWATDLHELEPDMIAIGKAFGGGYPFGGLVVRGELVDAELEASPWNVLTFMNQPLQAAAGLAVLDIAERESLPARAGELGARARTRFTELADRYDVIGDVRGPGLFIGLDLVTDRESRIPAGSACAEGWEYANELGLLTWFGGPEGNVFKFKPPLTTPEDEFEEMLDRVEQVIARVQTAVDAGRG